jgi:hypothetical protein
VICLLDLMMIGVFDDIWSWKCVYCYRKVICGIHLQIFRLSKKGGRGGSAATIRGKYIYHLPYRKEDHRC